MIWSFFGTLRDKYSRKNLSVEFPEAFESMLANAGDEQWDFYYSNQIQPCRIFYRDNFISKKKAVVIVSTKVKNKYNFGVDDIDSLMLKDKKWSDVKASAMKDDHED